MTDGTGLALLRDVQLLKKKRSISVGTIVTKNDHILRKTAQQHKQKEAKFFHVKKTKIPLVPQVHTVDISGKAIRPHG